MSKGGARNRSGPAPDPSSLRSDKRSWTMLARSHDVAEPAWPLTEASDRELTLWSLLWMKPQAVLWDRNQQVFEVAMHVRTLAEAEKPGAPVNSRTLVRQQADALLLTIPAMLAAGVQITDDEVARARAAKAAEPVEAEQSSVRERMRLLAGDN